MPQNSSQNISNVQDAGGSLIRKEIYSTLGTLTIIYLMITMVLFFKRRHKISDIRYRPLRLNILNSIATFVLCTMFCFRSGFYRQEFPCPLIHWSAYIGFSLYFTSLSCRVLSFVWLANYNLAKLRMDTTFGQNNHAIREKSEFSDERFMNHLKKWKRNATDKWLARHVVYPVVGFAFILALLLQVILPDLRIDAIRTECQLGPEHIPLTVFNSFFLVIICPTLIYFIHGIKDAYGLKNELMVTLISGTFSLIMFFVWELILPNLKSYFGSFMFAWITLMLCHTLSITVPVWKTFKKSSHFNSSGDSDPENNCNIGELIESGECNPGSRKFEQFKKVLADPELFELYKVCAAACFCTELILFLQEYQFLKTKVIQCCPPFEKELISPPSPVLHIAEIGRIPLQFLTTNATPQPLPPSYVITPCTESISVASWIPFPYELRSNFIMFYDTFMDPGSELAINFSGSGLNNIKNMIATDEFRLSMFESAREEVLSLLYVNTFDNFIRMRGSEVKGRGI